MAFDKSHLNLELEMQQSFSWIFKNLLHFCLLLSFYTVHIAATSLFIICCCRLAAAKHVFLLPSLSIICCCSCTPKHALLLPCLSISWCCSCKPCVVAAAYIACVVALLLIPYSSLEVVTQDEGRA